jgi:hypothetical protein
MSRRPRIFDAHQMAVSVLFTFLSACVSYERVPVSGHLADKPISTTVDSQLAAEYLQELSSGNAASRRFDALIADIQNRFDGLPLTSSVLRELSKRTSPDFATLFFIRKSLSDRANAEFQTRYVREVTRIKTMIGRHRWDELVVNGFHDYKFLFVPGFHYVTDPGSGAAFTSQREWMRKLGFNVELVLTNEDGTIQENAKLIAQAIRQESKPHAKLILVSTSKGGPETVLALGKMLKPAETVAVKGWISVGGLIRGTLLADWATEWPQSWFVRAIFSEQGIDPRSLPGLTARESGKRFDEIVVPQHILIIEYIAAPLSGDIASDVRTRYRLLRKYGPNDGLTLLGDELLADGITIFEPGLDHFYRDVEIDVKSLALANIAVDRIRRDAFSAAVVGPPSTVGNAFPTRGRLRGRISKGGTKGFCDRQDSSPRSELAGSGDDRLCRRCRDESAFGLK